MGERVTRAEFARRLGVTAPTVYAAIKRGRIEIGPDNLIDVDQLERYEANKQHSDPKRLGKPEPAAKRGPGRPPAPEPEAQDLAENDTDISYRDAQRLKEIYTARLAKLKYDEASGKLITSDDVKRAAFIQARKVRDQLLAIPDRIAPLLVGVDTYHEAHQLLTKELRKVLEGLGGMNDGTPQAESRHAKTRAATSANPEAD